MSTATTTIRGTARETAPPATARGRTLPLRRGGDGQLRRRRTLLMVGVAGRPALRPDHRLRDRRHPGGVTAAAAGGGRINLMDTATASAANFAATCLFVSAGFLLVVPVALFCGDTVASEASWSSLRYLLAAPVPRARLLWSQARRGARLQPGRDGAAAARRAGRGSGGLRLGAAEAAHRRRARPPGTVPRLALVVAFIFVSQLVTAGLAFWLSTKTDAPLGAVGGAVGLTIVGNVLDAVTALGSWREFLPAHWQFAWADALQPHLEWGGMVKGAAVSVTYALVLFALAFRGFSRKDIVS